MNALVTSVHAPTRTPQCSPVRQQPQEAARHYRPKTTPRIDLIDIRLLHNFTVGTQTENHQAGVLATPPRQLVSHRLGEALP